LVDLTPLSFTLQFNCPSGELKENYYNKVSIILLGGKYKLSFLVNCDPDSRHKQFEYGYFILAGLNAFILIGVARHSEVWSIKISGKRLRLTIGWIHVLVALSILLAITLVLYFLAFRDFERAFVGLHYFGIITSISFIFICFNEVFYLAKTFRYSIYKQLRICECCSLAMTIIVVIVAFFVDNWIYYNFMAVCICVASIKIFHFDSLKQAYISKAIVIAIFSGIAIVVHFIEPDRSYNDFATELSSPLFLVVPDLAKNLFKKCSWLFTVDIIFPGVMLSYLRLYDINRGSLRVGVYTLCGNVTVVLATIVWVALEYGYPFSVPFSLVVYLSIMFVIFVVSWTRNEWKDLWSGMF
jgi:hypothetical protein